MSEFDHALLKHLEELSRLDLDESEENTLVENLQKILSYIDMLSEVNTDDVEPCSHVVPNLKAPLRDDEPRDKITKNELLR